MYTLVHGNKAKLKPPSLALLRCKLTFEIFELDLIAVQNGFQIFRAWPYFGANRLDLIAMHQCKFYLREQSDDFTSGSVSCGRGVWQ